MANNKTTLRTQSKPDGDIETNILNEDGESANDFRQNSFDDLFIKLTDGFGQACEQEKIETAIAIAIDPKSKTPIIFIRGHHYDAGVLLANVLRQMTRNLIGPLNANPNYEPDDE